MLNELIFSFLLNCSTEFGTKISNFERLLVIRSGSSKKRTNLGIQ